MYVQMNNVMTYIEGDPSWIALLGVWTCHQPFDCLLP